MNCIHRFHGVTTVAELKLRAGASRIMGRVGFHGVTTVAELKQLNRDGIFPGGQPFPRRHNRGRIEATAGWRGGSRERRFHGVTTVAELKRTSASAGTKSDSRFHGVTTVAELKRRRAGTPIRCRSVSTASQPWPN